MAAALLFAACGGNESVDPAPVCGNGAVETGEACDDGNTADGDGCRADCLGSETCGDGLVDSGEACDDGNWALRRRTCTTGREGAAPAAASCWSAPPNST